MKKLLIALLCMLLCLTPALAAAEETQGTGEEQDVELDEFFRSMVGRISFTLPGLPLLIREPDLTEQAAKELGTAFLGWKNKVQLVGGSGGGAEFQVHIADVSPAISLMREARPGEIETDYQLNALQNLIQFYLNIHDGELTDRPTVDIIRPKDDDTDENALPVMHFSYRYPDAEGVEYGGKALIDGNLAVVMMCQMDEENKAVLMDMRPVAPEEAQAFASRQPEEVTMGRLKITFPVPPENHSSRGHYFSHVFTPDYAYLNAEHMALPLSLFLEEEDEEEGLRGFAEMSAQGYQEEGVIAEYTVFQACEGVYAFSAKGPDRTALGEVRDLMQAYFSLDGVYTVNAPDTEMGRAFLNSIEIMEEAAE